MFSPPTATTLTTPLSHTVTMCLTPSLSLLPLFRYLQRTFAQLNEAVCRGSLDEIRKLCTEQYAAVQTRTTGTACPLPSCFS